MASPQPGIFALGTRAHHHLEFDVPGEAGRVLQILGNIGAEATSVVGANVVIGVGPGLIAALDPADR